MFSESPTEEGALVRNTVAKIPGPGPQPNLLAETSLGSQGQSLVFARFVFGRSRVGREFEIRP